MKKEHLLHRIQNESEQWEKFLNDVGEEQMEEPGAMGDWTFKDAVAHLSTWRSRTLSQLAAVRSDRTPSAKFWPAEWDEDDEDDLEEINQWIYYENADRSLHDVLRESRQQFRYMYELVRVLPEDCLFDTERYDWMEGRPLVDLLDFGPFHKEHEAGLRQWLATLPHTECEEPQV